eukprot:589231-Pyramimonas_sp.AAC.1
MKTPKKFRAFVDRDGAKVVLRRAGFQVRTEAWGAPKGARGHRDEDLRRASHLSEKSRRSGMVACDASCYSISEGGASCLPSRPCASDGVMGADNVNPGTLSCAAACGAVLQSRAGRA